MIWIHPDKIESREKWVFPQYHITQRVRRLPPHKYNFAIQAIKQLQESGVVRESDSPWRSNVVLVPKPAVIKRINIAYHFEEQRPEIKILPSLSSRLI